jgi:hypothetical protein
MPTWRVKAVSRVTERDFRVISRVEGVEIDC